MAVMVGESVEKDLFFSEPLRSTITRQGVLAALTAVSSSPKLPQKYGQVFFVFLWKVINL